MSATQPPTASLARGRRRLELAMSLLFSLPGTPMMQYGDEIGMGDDLVLQGEPEYGRKI
jgi:glycosidase